MSEHLLDKVVTILVPVVVGVSIIGGIAVIWKVLVI